MKPPKFAHAFLRVAALLLITFAATLGQSPAAAAGDDAKKGAPGAGLVGFWLGVLKLSPVIGLRLSLEITSAPDGRLEGAMVSLDQGAARLPLTATVSEGGKVQMEIASIGGSFEGSFNADASKVAGEWQQGGQKLPLTFERVARATTLNRPQEPKGPLPYAEEDVVIEHQAARVKLAGTLTVPKGAGPHPAVVLLSGSGPQDRNETIMGHRPFLVLADHLTRQGIAVLRYDDRGVGKSTGDFAEALHTDFADDALAAVEWLKNRKEIDAQRIGLIGHSEGGIHAPLATVKKPGDIAFVVLLAGVGVPMQEVMIRQGSDIGRVMGIPADQIARSLQSQREWYPRLINAKDTAAAEQLAREMIQRQLAEYTPEQRAAMGMNDGMMASQVKMAASPWFRKLMAYDPKPVLQQVKCPVFAINGGKDLQVAARENLAGIRDALTAGGNKKVKTMEFPELNHLFQTCTTGAVSEYGQIEETFAPVALQAISDWVREQTGR